METIIKNILKGLGITPEMMNEKAEQFICLMKHYDSQLSEMNRRIGVMEQNISVIMNHLDINQIEDNISDAEIVPLTRRK